MATQRRVKLPTKKILEIWHGNTFTWKYRMESPEDTPLDTTGWQVDMDVRTALDDAVIVRYSTTNGKILLTGTPDFWIQFDLDLDDVNALAPGEYLWGLRHTYADATSEPIWENSALIVYEVAVRDA